MAASIMNVHSWKVGVMSEINIHLCIRLLLLVAPEAAGTIIATQVIFAFHMLFVNILLINLLIALFRYVKLGSKSIRVFNATRVSASL